MPRKGRPSAKAIAEAIEKIGTVRSKTQGLHICGFCCRIFPRNKSLKTHVRTHTGVKPYRCTYPDCGNAFRQSGQLKTHQFRHTGERRFACPVKGCSQRFTHTNRKCQKHPKLKLIKDGMEQVVFGEHLSSQEIEWLEKYVENKENPPKKRKILRSCDTSLDLSPGDDGAAAAAILDQHIPRHIGDESQLPVFPLFSTRHCVEVKKAVKPSKKESHDNSVRNSTDMHTRTQNPPLGEISRRSDAIKTEMELSILQGMCACDIFKMELRDQRILSQREREGIADLVLFHNFIFDKSGL